MKLYFEDTGEDKEALVLVAGFVTDAVSWVFQRESFAQQYRLITLDNRGVGRSPIPPGPYTIGEMADDLAGVLDGLGLSRVRLLGHSMGGAIVQQFARRHPQRVEKMLLASSFSQVTGRTIPVLQSWADCLRLGGTADDMANALFPWLYTEHFFETPGAYQGAVEAFRQHPYPLSQQGIEGQLQALLRFDSRPWLGDLKAPTLVVVGQEDLLVSTASAKKLAQSLGNGRLEVLPATGHSLMLETPAEFNRCVLEFMGES